MRVDAKDLALSWTVSLSAVRQLMSRPDAPQRGTDKKWDKVAADKFREKRLALQKASLLEAEELGALDKAKLAKLELECERIRKAIRREEREVIEVREAAGVMNEVADMFVSSLESFASQVAAITKDAAVLGAAEKLADDARKTMADRITERMEEWATEKTESAEGLQDESNEQNAAQ